MSTELRVTIEFGETDGSTHLRTARCTSIFASPSDQLSVEDVEMWIAQSERIVTETAAEFGRTLRTLRDRIDEDASP